MTSAIVVQAGVDPAFLDPQHVALARHRVEEAMADLVAAIAQARAHFLRR
jgi:hypothetical protein